MSVTASTGLMTIDTFARRSRRVYFNPDPEPDPNDPFCDIAFPIRSA